MAQLYLLWHGQSSTNTTPERIGGRGNWAPLTELSNEQAAKAGDYMARLLIRPSIVAVSPAERTVQTAAAALKSMNYHGKVYLEPMAQELSQGAAEGLLRTDVWTEERLREVAEQGKDFKLPGAESVNEVGERMLEAVYKLDRLTRQTERPGTHAENARGLYLPECGLMVTHEVAIKALVAHVMDYSQEWVYTTRIPNAALTRITVNGTLIGIDTLGVNTQA